MDKVDIRDMPEVCEVVNNILNNKGTAEIKLERGGTEIVVVEPTRYVKLKDSVK